MDQALEVLQDTLEGQIDFEGQRQAELLTTALLSIFGGIAFIVGYVMQDISKTLYIGLGGTALTFLLVIPPWPVYNKNPVKWLPKAAAMGDYGISVDGKKVD